MESTTGSRDSAFLHEKIRQLEEQLKERDLEFQDLQDELGKETGVCEQLTLQNEQVLTEYRELTHEKERRSDNISDIERQIESQRELYDSVISIKDEELQQCQDDIRMLMEDNERLESQQQSLAQAIEETAQEADNLAEEHNQMRLNVQESHAVMRQLTEQRGNYIRQVSQLRRRFQALEEEDRKIKRDLDAGIEQWEMQLEDREKELEEYQRMAIHLEEELKIARMEEDNLQQALEERDSRIEQLNADIRQQRQKAQELLFQRAMRKIRKDKNRHRVEDLQATVRDLQSTLKRTKRRAKRANNEYKEKERELEEALARQAQIQQEESERRSKRTRCQRILSMFCCCIFK